MRFARPYLLLGFVFAGIVTPRSSKATLIIGIEQVGSDVVATASGSINANLASPTTSFGADYLNISADTLTFGPAVTVNDYQLTGPTSLGSGNQLNFASSSSGASIAFLGNLSGFGGTGLLGLSQTYVAGSAISSADTFSGTTLAGLGITTGTYTFTVGTALTTDTLIIDAGVPVPGTSVPEPATVALAGVGFPALCVWVIRRRKQNTPTA